MQTLKVLVADDHEGFRRLLSAFLRTQQGVEIIGEAKDGIEAVDQAERLHPDLVLMDLDMPNQDGFTATREIKDRVPETKVIILSMHGGEVYRRMAWKHAADGFIDKGSMKNALITLLLNEQARLELVPVRVTAA
jgi:DNA-binding NarL/FixJ family response regulator